jgi:sulfite reductase alpha subunit-like flavoprotein
VGDTVLVRWYNDPCRVEAVREALAATGSKSSPDDEASRGRPSNADRPYFMVGHSSVFQPGRLRLLPLRRILEEELELYTAAPELQQRVATVGNSPLDQLSPGDAGGGRGIDLLTVLRRAAPAITPNELIRYQRRNTARAYSVSRIVPHDRYDEIEIIVSAVQTHLKQAEGPIVSMEGRATAWFRRLAEVDLAGETDDTGGPPVFVQAWRLRHPWRLDVVGTRPMIIVVAGTGIAGVLAWLRDTTPKGPVWLIYGVRDWRTRGLYQEELTQLVQDGTLVRLDIAESRSPETADTASGGDRDPGHDVMSAEFHLHRRMRVNHVIESEDETLRAMIAGGAGIYISGPRPMGEAARQSIMWALGEDASPDLLERWDAEGRLQVSVS